MKRVKLWPIGKRNGSGTWTAVDVPRADNADTESLLESLLTDSPQLLMDGLKLVGRQIPTEGGPSLSARCLEGWKEKIAKAEEETGP